MAGRHLGQAGGGVVLDEGGAEEVPGRRTGAEALGRLGQVPGQRDRAALRPGRRRAPRPAAAVRGAPQCPRGRRRGTWPGQWWGLTSAPGMRSSSRAVSRVVGHHPQGAAVVADAPGGGGRGPVARPEAPVGVRDRAPPGPAARAAAPPRRQRPPRRPWTARPAPRRGRGAPSTVECSDRLGWPPSPGNCGPSWAMKVACWPAPGEEGLGVELGQQRPSRPSARLLGGGGHFEAARARARRTGGRAGRRRRRASSTRPASDVVLGAMVRPTSSGCPSWQRLGVGRCPPRARCIRTPTPPGLESRGGGALDQSGTAARGREFAQRGREVGQEEGGVVAEGIGAPRVEVDERPGNCVSRPGARRVVGAPPLDGVDEAPPRRRPVGRRGGPSRFSRRVPEASNRPRWTVAAPASGSAGRVAASRSWRDAGVEPASSSRRRRSAWRATDGHGGRAALGPPVAASASAAPEVCGQACVRTRARPPTSGWCRRPPPRGTARPGLRADPQGLHRREPFSASTVAPGGGSTTSASCHCRPGSCAGRRQKRGSASPAGGALDVAARRSRVSPWPDRAAHGVGQQLMAQADAEVRPRSSSTHRRMAAFSVTSQGCSLLLPHVHRARP